MGALTPAPVSGAFQRTFFVADQRTGRSFSPLTPLPAGPRQAGQSPALAAGVRRSADNNRDIRSR
jgi:hypothetical protein